jgi:hypothetical protein
MSRFFGLAILPTPDEILTGPKIVYAVNQSYTLASM